MTAPFRRWRTKPMGDAPDAIVVGSGPNGLAAAITLADAGLRVHVYEGAATPGGGARTEELTLPGFRHDVCSTAHPLALASPFFRRFDLSSHDVRLLEPEVQYAHPLDGGRAGFVVRSVDETADALGADGAAYRRWCWLAVRHSDDVIDLALSTLRMPPRHPLRVVGFGLTRCSRRLSWRDTSSTAEARGLLAGVAAHSMQRLSRPPRAQSGSCSTIARARGRMAGHRRAGRAASSQRWSTRSRTPAVPCLTDQWITSLDPSCRRHVRCCLTSPRDRFSNSAGRKLPSAYRRALSRYPLRPRGMQGRLRAVGAGALDSANRADVPGTVHLGGTFEQVAQSEDDVAAGRHPERPYVLVVQAGVVDSESRAGGQHTLWTYCHVPSGSTVDMSARIEAQIERFAPGFRDLDTREGGAHGCAGGGAEPKLPRG